MYKSLYKSYNPSTFAVASCRDGDEIVKNGLAVTPSQMLELTNKGLAVSSTINSMVEQEPYRERSDMYVEPRFRRGCDMADMFNMRLDVQDKFRDASKNYKFDKPSVTETGGSDV